MANQFDFVYLVFPGDGRGYWGPSLDKDAAEAYAESWDGYLVGLDITYVKSFNPNDTECPVCKND